MILERSAHGCPVHKAALEALPRTGTLKATFRFDRQLGVAYISRGRKERTAHGLGHLALRAAERAQVLGGLEQKLALLFSLRLLRTASSTTPVRSSTSVGALVSGRIRSRIFLYGLDDFSRAARKLDGAQVLPRALREGRSKRLWLSSRTPEAYTFHFNGGARASRVGPTSLFLPHRP